MLFFIVLGAQASEVANLLAKHAMNVGVGLMSFERILEEVPEVHDMVDQDRMCVVT